MNDMPYNLITAAGAKPIYAWTHGSPWRPRHASS